MGIDGSDARIQVQKLSDVDQIDKQQQETQRGEVGATREKAEAERERRKARSAELERQDKVLIRQRPHRKGKEQSAEEEEAKERDEAEKAEAADSEKDPAKGIGRSLDVKG